VVAPADAHRGGDRDGVAVLTCVTNLGATDPKVHGRVRPSDLGRGCHWCLSVNRESAYVHWERNWSCGFGGDVASVLTALPRPRGGGEQTPFRQGRLNKARLPCQTRSTLNFLDDGSCACPT